MGINPNQIIQRGGGVVRGGVRIGMGLGRRVVSEGWGLIQEARHLQPKPKAGMDDVTLTRKVESEIFRARGAPKSTVNVNVVDGVVWLRGEVKRPEQIRSLERKARSIPEVRGVENLLHLVKTPAATRADTPRRQQRTRSTTRRPTPRRRTAGHVSDDQTDSVAQQAEPSPAEHASKGEGRSPAPLGSSGQGEQPAAAPPSPEPAAGPTNQPGAARKGEPSTSGNGGAAGTGGGTQGSVSSAGTPSPGEAGTA